MSVGLPNIRTLVRSGYFWIFITAALLRGIYLVQAFAGNELIAQPLVDAEVYVDWSRDILAGKWLWYEPMHYTPVIPAWIAGWTAISGWWPALHFCAFHLLGALQAVVIGKTAEHLWSRRVGLFTGALAAVYWPLIIFEATYYAEAFAIWNFALGFYLLVRWWRLNAGNALLVWAGFHFGLSTLARANAMLCLPILGLAVIWLSIRVLQRSRGAGLRAAIALLLPPLLLCLPVLLWNWNLTGKPMLRTGGWLSVYLGNNPEGRGLVVPAGERWNNFVYQPVRAGVLSDAEQEGYWRKETLGIITGRTGEWLALMGRKALLFTNRFEVSQEIDIDVFRQSSGVLSAPIFPGWGTLAPLTLFAALAMLKPGESRRGLLLLLCAAAYFGSILPVQACARYRLPVVVPMLPLAGWALAELWAAVRARHRSTIISGIIIIVVTGALVWPDWLGMRTEKIINHQFLVGLKRAEAGDSEGAYRAFAAGHAWNPADPDCPLRMAMIRLNAGQIEEAQALFEQASQVMPEGFRPILGFGECALARKQPAETLKHVETVLAIAPNNLNALLLASRAYGQLNDWSGMARACALIAGYPVHDVAVDFAQAMAWIRAGAPNKAMKVYQSIASNLRLSPTERDRAIFLAGALALRTGATQQANQVWALLTTRNGFFGNVVALMQNPSREAEIVPKLSAASSGPSLMYVDYALAHRMNEAVPTAQQHEYLEALLRRRNARTIPPDRQDVLEIWALEDLAKTHAH